MRHKKKQKGIGGDVQVEINETMHEKATCSDQSRELQGSCKGITDLTQALEGHAQQDNDEPATTKASEKPRACDRVVEEDSPRIAAHGGTLAGSRFKGLQR